MTTAKVMIVDDSAFSRAIIAEALTENGCKVVGESESFETLIETYKTCKPDIVTMDIVMPGSDGFECSRSILLQDPSAKIILLSSMKDEETEIEAKRIGIAGYVQKPVESEHLIKVINNVLAPDVLYEKLTTWGINAFKEALSQNITSITKATSTITEKDRCLKSASQEIIVVIGITGKYPGTIIIALEKESAEKMAEIVFRRVHKNQEEVIAMVAEFANVVGGVACSMLNKKEKELSLRVTPPSLFYGKSTEIINPTIQLHNICAETNFGKVHLNVGFKKETTLWM